MDKTFSVIIPHKNIPDLLLRCLKSIPKRDDLEIIIIDDTSSSEIVDFNRFPGTTRDDVRLIFNRDGMGQGHVLNLAILQSKGRWLIFADADDYFNDCFADILEDYKDSDADVIYFSSSSVDSDNTKAKSMRTALQKQRICDFIKDGSVGSHSDLMIRYMLASPWGKLIKRDVIIRNQISFSETKIRIDVKFCYLLGYFAKTLIADKREAYCATYRKTSVSYSPLSEEKIVDMVTVFAERDKFFWDHDIFLPNDCFFHYSGILADLKLKGRTELLAKCIKVLENFNAPMIKVNEQINIELLKRKTLNYKLKQIRIKLALGTRCKDYIGKLLKHK